MTEFLAAVYDAGIVIAIILSILMLLGWGEELGDIIRRVIRKLKK